MRDRGSIAVHSPAGPCPWETGGTCTCTNPRWRVRASVHRDPLTGRERRLQKVIRAPHNRTGRRTAETELAKLIAQAEAERRDQQAAPERMTVTEAVDRWIAHNRDRWAGNTLGNYLLARKRIDRGLGHRIVSTVTVGEVEQFYRRCQGDGIGAATIQQMHKVLSGAFTLAVRWGAISASPIREVRRPTVALPELAPPDPERLRSSIEQLVADHPDIAAWVLVAAGTGMRPGEQCGLRWSDIDLDAGTAAVRRAVKRNAPGAQPAWIVAETKTHRGRTVSLGAGIVAALRALRERQLEAEWLAMVDPDPDAWVFPGAGGGHSNPQGWYQRWARRNGGAPSVRERYGLAGVSLYLLRHWAATQMVAAGHDPTSVAAQLGHSRTVLLDRYSHTVDDRVTAAAATLDGLLTG